MPLLDTFHILPEQEELFYKSVVVKYGWWGDKADKKVIVFRKRNFEDIIDQSLFPDVATAWNSLNDRQKGLWSDAGQWSSQSGWNLFAQDTAYRIANGIAGIGEPNAYHQYFVGKITINAPATDIIIKQNVNISLLRDFEYTINYMCNMVSCGTPDWIEMYLYFYGDFGQGYGLWSENFGLYPNDRWEFTGDAYDWTGLDVSGMYMQIEIHNYRGNLYIDGIGLIANDINIANDFQCDSIENSWQAVNAPAGASFQSVYSRNSFYYP